MQAIKISVYLTVFILSNFIVLYFGSNGLIITALLLIPFDFVMRCVFHESWHGKALIINLSIIVCLSSLITFLINIQTINIAIGSACAFIAAQLVASIFYQINKNKSFFVKVNGSDLFAIVFDSIVFQLVAFNSVDFFITASQILLKIIGGFFWYWFFFKAIKIQKNLL